MNLLDHELVNDLASAYRGKRMRDGIRDMGMAEMPEAVAERFYDALGEHADKVRGELHRMIEEDEMSEGCGCGCGADCPCMKQRVAGRFAAVAKPLDLKGIVEKLARATEKAFKGKPGVGTTVTDVKSSPGFEVGEVYVNGSEFQIRLVGITQEGNISVGAFSGSHPLTSLGSRGPATDAAKRLKKPIDFILGRLAKKATPTPSKKPSVDEVRDRLRSMRLGPGGSVSSVDALSSTEWSVEPKNRLRLDHYGNDGEGWDEEGWEDEYARPLRTAAEKWLEAEFGKGIFAIDVDEKGFVTVALTSEGKKHYGV